MNNSARQTLQRVLERTANQPLGPRQRAIIGFIQDELAAGRPFPSVRQIAAERKAFWREIQGSVIALMVKGYLEATEHNHIGSPIAWKLSQKGIDFKP